MRIETGRGLVQVSQKAYIENLLKRFNVDGRQMASTPMAVNITELEVSTSSKLQTRDPYQCIVGSLNYLAHASRPDIMFAVNTLSRFLMKPQQIHLEAAIRVLRYLNRTKDMTMHFRDATLVEGNLLLRGLCAFCDTSYPSKDTPDS
tara:strand:+ start:457 stop:897 length:441 start_codon:yes stop_codon:yes gene_type:complete